MAQINIPLRIMSNGDILPHKSPITHLDAETERRPRHRIAVIGSTSNLAFKILTPCAFLAEGSLNHTQLNPQFPVSGLSGGTRTSAAVRVRKNYLARYD